MSPSRPDLHQMQSRPCKYRTAAHHIGLRIRERVYTHTHTSSYSSDLRTSLSLYLCMCVHIRARIMLCVADISSYKAVVTVVYERTNSFNVFVCRFVRGRVDVPNGCACMEHPITSSMLFANADSKSNGCGQPQSLISSLPLPPTNVDGEES